MKIVVVEDQALMRELLVNLLVNDLGHELAGLAIDGETALKLIRDTRPDLVILDVLIPKLSGIHVAKTIKSELPNIRILILSNQMDAKTLLQLHQMYLAGFVDKNEASVEVLTEAIRVIGEKKRYFSETMKSSIKKLKSDPMAFQKILTRREQEVLTHIGAGLSDEKIGKLLGLSPTSIQSHRSNLFRKLDVHSTTELIQFASETGFWKPEFKRMDLTDTYHLHE